MKTKLIISLLLLSLSIFSCNKGKGDSNSENLLTAKKGDTVLVHYTLTVDGQKRDSSRDKNQPFQFVLGKKMVVPGFDNAVVGMKINEEKKVVVSAKDGYGEKDKRITEEVPMERLPLKDLKEGETRKIKTPMGEIEIQVESIKDGKVKFSMANPSQLAGKTLNFDIKLIALNPALTQTIQNDVQAKEGDTVIVHYVLTVDEKELDSSKKRNQPFQFVLGKKMVVPGFNKAVIGMKVNEEKKVTISPEEGYGHKDDLITQEVPMMAFQGKKPVVGKATKLKTPYGQEIEVTVKEIKGQNVVVSMKNPNQLAGKTLNFDIKLIAVNP